MSGAERGAPRSCYLVRTMNVWSAPFHLSIFVSDLESTRAFYAGVLGCFEGHSAPGYADFAFFGNQLSCHVAPEQVRSAAKFGLDGNHFGVVLSAQDFDALIPKLRDASVTFLTEPRSERTGSEEERRRFVISDPSGNAIEVKTYAHDARIFG